MRRAASITVGLVLGLGLIALWVAVGQTFGERDYSLWLDGMMEDGGPNVGPAGTAVLWWGMSLAVSVAGWALWAARTSRPLAAEGLGTAVAVLTPYLLLFLSQAGGGAAGAAAVLLVGAALAAPWWHARSLAAPTLAPASIPFLVWGFHDALYRPLEPLFGVGPTGVRPASVVVFAMLVTVLFVGYTATVLLVGRRLDRRWRGAHTIALAVMAVLFVGPEAARLNPAFAAVYMVPVAVWAGAASLLVVGDPVRHVRWSVWGAAVGVGVAGATIVLVRLVA